MKLTAGQLRHRIALEAPETTTTPSGQVKVTGWATVAASVPARVETSGGTERAAADSIRADQTHEVWLRYRSGVTSRLRAVWRGRPLDILLVDDSHQHLGQLRLLCKEGLSQGS